MIVEPRLWHDEWCGLIVAVTTEHLLGHRGIGEGKGEEPVLASRFFAHKLSIANVWLEDDAVVSALHFAHVNTLSQPRFVASGETVLGNLDFVKEQWSVLECWVDGGVASFGAVDVEQRPQLISPCGMVRMRSGLPLAVLKVLI